MTDMNVFRMPEWYSKIASDCFPTVFVEMNAAVLDALKAGRQEEDPAVKEFLPKLEHAMDKFPSLRFLSVDTAAPTDTERFLIKRGAVHSAKSAWRILCSSVKVRQAADAGLVTCICVRPFRRMQPAREFRLFIKDGKLAGMSQYWLKGMWRRCSVCRNAGKNIGNVPARWWNALRRSCLCVIWRWIFTSNPAVKF